jgi:Protein of unknown function (DUF3747)
MAIASAGIRATPATAQMTQQELDPNGVVVVASPYQNGEQHQLLIVEQLTRARACWSEQKTNSSVTLINPLLSEFDFSGICGRATDSNGFSVRMAGRDLNWRYSLQIMEKEGDLLLIARSNNPKKTMPDFLIGRVGGKTTDFAKISLEPGWRVSRRIANGQLTGHFYLTTDQTLEQLVAMQQGSAVTATTANPMSNPPTANIPPVSGPTPVPESMIQSTPTVPAPLVVPPAPPVR